MKFKQKLAVVLSAATVLMSALPTLGASGEATISGGYIKGDLNGDDHVTVSDMVILSQYLTRKATLTSDQLVIADMNNDNSVNIFDMNLVKRTVLEIREVEVVEETTEATTEAPVTTEPPVTTIIETMPVTTAPEIETTVVTTEDESIETTIVTTEADIETTVVTTEIVPVTTEAKVSYEFIVDPAIASNIKYFKICAEFETTCTLSTTIIYEENPSGSKMGIPSNYFTNGICKLSNNGIPISLLIEYYANDLTFLDVKAVLKDGTEVDSYVAPVVTEPVTTEAEIIETTVVTTIVTEPVTTEVIPVTTESNDLGFPYEINIDPANTKAVEGAKFTVDADVNYNGAVQFFTEEDGNIDVNYSNADAIDGVITVNVPEEIEDPSAITMIKICKYWQADGEAIKLVDAKAIIDGEEVDSYVAPAKTANSDAVIMGSLGENSIWGLDDLGGSSLVVPRVDKNGTYTAKLILNKPTDSISFLMIGIDGLRKADFADLAITVDSVKVDETALETFDAAKVVVNTSYAEGSFNGTRIYFNDLWGKEGEAAIPTNTTVTESIKITFTVSGIND